MNIGTDSGNKVDLIPWLQNEIMYLLVIAVTVFLSYLSRVLVEKPALNLKYSKKKDKKLTV